MNRFIHCMRKVKYSSNLCLVWDNFMNDWTFTYPEAIPIEGELVYIPTKNLPDSVLFIKGIQLLVKNIPVIPLRKYEGRKKIRGYSRKIRSHKNNVVKFKNELPGAVSNFIYDCIEFFKLPPINNLN